MISPYNLDEVDRAQLEELQQMYTTDDLWALEDTESVRKRIKSYYINAQSNTCCYCSHRILSSNHRMWDLDHIVPRATHPKFCFEPQNLAVSCPDCNRIKSQKQTLLNGNRIRFPNQSSDYRIAHPHFDNYNDHIGRLNLIYFAKTSKGQNTIEMCGLLRFTVNHVDWDIDPSDDRFENEFETIITGDKDEAQEALRALKIIFNS